MRKVVLSVMSLCIFGFVNGDNLHERFLKNELSGDYKTQWITVKDAKKWAEDCLEKQKSESEQKADNIDEILRKTEEIWAKDSHKDADLVVIFRAAGVMFLPFNIIAATECFNKVVKIAGDNYNIALKILESQSDELKMKSDDVEEIKFHENFDYDLIGKAIHILKAEERSGNKKATTALEKVNEQIEKSED